MLNVYSYLSRLKSCPVDSNLICDVCLYFKVDDFRPKKSELEEAVLKQVLKSSKAFESTSIDQRAFLRSRADHHNVDLQKYVDEVKAEMKKDEAEGNHTVR